MHLKELRYIITIAEEQSICRAADKLFMAQSSLSQFLQLYETELGTALFFRTAQGVRLTEAGKVFVEAARRMMKDYHGMRNHLWDMEILQAGRITMGISSFRGSYLLPPVLKKFYEWYPNIRVDIIEANSMALEERLLEGTLDLALVVLPVTRLKHDTQFLRKDEVILVAKRDHPVTSLLHSKADYPYYWIDLKDTAPFEFILSDYDTILGKVAREEFKAAGIEPIAENTNITAAFAAAMARAGLGLAFTYSSCAEPHPDTVYFSVGPEGIFLDLALVYPPSGYRSKAALALGDALHHYASTVNKQDISLI